MRIEDGDWLVKDFKSSPSEGAPSPSCPYCDSPAFLKMSNGRIVPGKIIVKYYCSFDNSHDFELSFTDTLKARRLVEQQRKLSEMPWKHPMTEEEEKEAQEYEKELLESFEKLPDRTYHAGKKRGKRERKGARRRRKRD
ncbi:MAG: hypothetical protein LYZ69_09500 [Nitrososphaerales archaeon]|nr:hypothetical protein [Nitrososphaerales archaeon]